MRRGTRWNQGKRPRLYPVPSVRVPKAKLLRDERRHSPERVAAVRPIVAQHDRAVTTIEEKAGHGPPRILGVECVVPPRELERLAVDLVPRNPHVRRVLTIHAPHSLGVQHGSGEDARVRRLFGTTDVDLLLALIAAEVDNLPV